MFTTPSEPNRPTPVSILSRAIARVYHVVWIIPSQNGGPPRKRGQQWSIQVLGAGIACTRHEGRQSTLRDCEELRDAIMEVYDLAGNLLDLTLQTEEYLSAVAHESLLEQTNTVLAAISALLPQALHDTLAGKGKGVAKSE
ncbi:hypothetical protein CNYM01_10109 [Colletotrichum nymphaeae SA-01]|uniref:Uncharacterized protein n=1 Tax=Colletotrichum nymphaeae SA-01 TaxID=1460502 RepID=A0A135T9L6_9PEZI|nr:hypothetical protein CNYM01_10109 [Colletotrichum nymphaeae SA-01]